MATAKRSALKELKCPNCGAPVSQYTADAQTIVCSACGTYMAMEMEGPSAIGKGRKLPTPPVPINVGDTANMLDTEFFVLGRVVYRGWDDEDKWVWDEWLLGGADGRMLWMSYYDEEGFGVYKKLRIREPFDAKLSDALPTGSGKHVPVRERYPAQILGAEGELTWRTKPGDQLYMAEAFGNGKRYSVQQTNDELEIHEGVAMSNEDIAKAFNKPEWQKAIASTANRGQLITIVAILFIMFAIWGFVAAVWASSTGEEILRQSLTLSTANPIATIPVEFNQPGRASVVAVRAQSALPMQTYADIDISIDSPDETENDLFTLELWRESGSDDEGYWEETQASASDMFVPFQAGVHTLEVALGEATLDNVSIDVTIRRNHVLPTWFAIYGAIVGILGIVILFFRYRKQVNKFAESVSDDD